MQPLRMPAPASVWSRRSAPWRVRVKTSARAVAVFGLGQDGHEQIALLAGHDAMHDLFDLRHRGRARPGIDDLRVGQIGAGEFLDGVVHRGREEHRLALGSRRA